MKTNHWIERILVSLTVFCLAVTSFGVEPAQASPPAQTSYKVVYYMQPWPKKLCLNQEYTFRGYFTLEPIDKSAKAKILGDISGKLDNALGDDVPIIPGGWIMDGIVGIPRFIDIEYKATKAGDEQLKIDFYLGDDIANDKLRNRVRIWGTSLDFKVEACLVSLHGTADMGATANALSPGDTWNFVGTYDVAGTVEMNEGGMANGQGTASMFMDGVAAESQVGCEFTSPIQGNTTVEVKADPEAWAKGSLQLQIHLESMPVSFGGIGCTSFGGKWTTGGAAVTTASFDLDPVSLPANGGATSLEFELPGQPGTFKMDLIAVIEEAGS